MKRLFALLFIVTAYSYAHKCPNEIVDLKINDYYIATRKIYIHNGKCIKNRYTILKNLYLRKKINLKGKIIGIANRNKYMQINTKYGNNFYIYLFDMDNLNFKPKMFFKTEKYLPIIYYDMLYNNFIVGGKAIEK